MFAAAVVGGVIPATGSALSARVSIALPGGNFYLSASQMSVHEHDGAALIKVLRHNAADAGHVFVRANPISARPGQDFTAIAQLVNFGAGQSEQDVRVPIVDHGVPLPSRFFNVHLYGGFPGGDGSPEVEKVTIINDDAAGHRDSNNPLGLPTAPTNGDPLSGAKWYVWHGSDTLRLAGVFRLTQPVWSRALNVIGAQPQSYRVGFWDSPSVVATRVSKYLEEAQYTQPGTVPQLSTYTLVHGQCRNGTNADSPSAQKFWNNWVNGLARGIGGYRAVVFLEEDSLITIGCLSSNGVGIRLGELRYGINTLLAKCPHIAIYLDAGAADAVPAKKIAGLLNRAQISKIQGFFLNATHFDWTLNEIHFGNQISSLTHGAHFVVNTAENGIGPVVPSDRVRDGNEVLCNPEPVGLGPLPTASTGYPKVDMFAWIFNPGQSDYEPGSICGGPLDGTTAPPDGTMWPAYAAMVVAHADLRVR